jgi:hypothetical protein
MDYIGPFFLNFSVGFTSGALGTLIKPRVEKMAVYLYRKGILIVI